MGRLIDVGQFATGVFAFGQVATGVVAIGQIATGVIAIGQVARGGIAIGMVSFGFVTVGMLSVGVARTTAMIGMAGTRGFGLVLPLIPLPARRPKLPPCISAELLRAGEIESGWVPAYVREGPEGAPVFRTTGRHGGGLTSLDLGVRMDSRLRAAASTFVGPRTRYALVHVSRLGDRLVWDRILELPESAGSPGYILRLVLGLTVLAAICVVFWAVVVAPIGDTLLGPGGLLR